MAVVNPRNRTVIFRLTEEEYNALQAACSVRGARSLSDYARAKILSAGDSATGGPLAQVEERLIQLNTAVEQLTRMLEKT